MYSEAIKYFQSNQIDIRNFDYFDYAQFFETLDPEKLAVNPHKRKIVERFLQKCDQKLLQKQKSKGGWKRFLERTEQQRKYQQEKSEALRFLNEHYDFKTDQLLFYPKLNKSKATQKGRFWKDIDDQISIEGEIYKPNESTFQQ